MASKATVLYEAEFNPKLKKYLLWAGAMICFLTIFGIIILPLWFLFGSYFLNRYFERLECELTTRSLRFKKGYIFHTERTIPLDKIQDLTFKEGPLLKYFGLSILKVETAGSSGQGGADLSLIGIIGATEFRNMVLEQRDSVTDNIGSGKTDPSDGEAESVTALLTEIRDSLHRLERSSIPR